jgi:pimeloyl-ACP methyl ester carboxylesterase
VQIAHLSTGVSVAYSVRGAEDGVPMLLLHAWDESHACFDMLLPLLPTSIRTFAMDQRGHGDSDKPKDGYELTEMANDAEAFLDAVGVRSAVLLGTSSGGYVAQQIAVTSPDRVTAVVLVGAPRSLYGRAPFADEVDQLTDQVDGSWVRRSFDWFPRFHDVPESYLEDRVADGVRIPADVWRGALAGLTSATPPIATAIITAPTLMIRGDRDEIVTRRDTELLAAAMPNSTLLEYESTGHLVLWEQPERVAADVARFVSDLG